MIQNLVIVLLLSCVLFFAVFGGRTRYIKCKDIHQERGGKNGGRSKKILILPLIFLINQIKRGSERYSMESGDKCIGMLDKYRLIKVNIRHSNLSSAHWGVEQSWTCHFTHPLLILYFYSSLHPSTWSFSTQACPKLVLSLSGKTLQPYNPNHFNTPFKPLPPFSISLSFPLWYYGLLSPAHNCRWLPLSPCGKEQCHHVCHHFPPLPLKCCKKIWPLTQGIFK